ncbi:ArsR/SmtB family transcription factor [Labrys monachus]|nr:helix-turn-helix domain-containing protein [Labrys monachus]
MDTQETISALAALAQGTRLDVFRLLVQHEPEGLPAGEIARQTAVPHNTMSTHLGILTRAGLIRPERRSRLIIYRADLDKLRNVLAFLLKDCCGGHAEICAPLIADISACCPAESTEKVPA